LNEKYKKKAWVSRLLFYIFAFGGENQIEKPSDLSQSHGFISPTGSSSTKDTLPPKIQWIFNEQF